MNGKRSIYFLDRILEKSMGRWVKRDGKGKQRRCIRSLGSQANLRGLMAPGRA